MNDRDKTYLNAIASVLNKTKSNSAFMATPFRSQQFVGVPFRFVGKVISGPQCVTVNLKINDRDLKTVLGLGDRFAMVAGSRFARVYRDLGLVRVEFTLPPGQWTTVRLGDLLHRRDGSATIGQKALGPVARVDWETPHKAIFGATQSGKSTLFCDFIISLAGHNSPDTCRFLILNPKNDPKFHPFVRLPHLAARASSDYEDSAALLRFALKEMEERKLDNDRQKVRWIIFIDEVSQLIENIPATGPMITQLSQMAGGLNIKLVVASQSANPTAWGAKGSLARANFTSRIILELPREQAYLAAGIDGLQTDKLGGEKGQGDSYAVRSGVVTRFRAALPTEADYANLPRSEAEPAAPGGDDQAGDRAMCWSMEELADKVGYALAVKNSSEQIRRQFGGGTERARWIRDLTKQIKVRQKYWEGER